MSGLGDILTGGLGGLFGDGGSSSSVTSTVNVDIQGLDKIGLNETIELKPIEVKPLKVTLNENVTLKPVTLNENVDLKPVTLNENIDLKPVAVDTCQTLRLAPLPETRVSNPYHHRVTYHLFGMEMMNISYAGESGQNVESPHHPQVVEGPRWGGGHRDEHPMIVGESPGIRVRVLRPDEE